jgi:hypothetical protein
MRSSRIPATTAKIMQCQMKREDDLKNQDQDKS